MGQLVIVSAHDVCNTRDSSIGDSFIVSAHDQARDEIEESLTERLDEFYGDSFIVSAHDQANVTPVTVPPIVSAHD
jgi:hypothetical protein